MKLSSSNIKKFLTFSQKKAFISGNRNPPKNSLIFQETKFSYVSGSGNPKKLLIFQEVKKFKKFLIFQEMELSSSKKLRRNWMLETGSNWIMLETRNLIPLGGTGCLSNLYYLLAAIKHPVF